MTWTTPRDYRRLFTGDGRFMVRVLEAISVHVSDDDMHRADLFVKDTSFLIIYSHMDRLTTAVPITEATDMMQGLRKAVPAAAIARDKRVESGNMQNL